MKYTFPKKSRQNEWFFGSIPETWRALPLKYLCSKSSVYGANLSAEEYINDGVRFIRTSDICDDGTLEKYGVYVLRELVKDYILKEGDFLISRSGTIGRAYVHEEQNGTCAYAGYLVRYVLQHIEYARYIFYVTKTPYFQQWLGTYAVESTIGNVNGEKYANMLVPCPGTKEQNDIVDYLDREIDRIDRLIATKERLLVTLAEKRQTLIDYAVIRGVNPSAPLHETKIPWLRQIPAHWELERTKWLFKERDERSLAGEEELLSVSHLTGVTPRSEKDVSMFEAETNEGYKVCHAGDLVINTLWAWMGAMGISPVDGIVSPAYNVYTPGERLEASYVDALVRIPIFAQEATRYSKGVWSSRLRLYPEGFFEIWMPVPPKEEQREIVAHISSETAKLDALKTAAEKTIALLKERRSALIAAAVTGQIEVN